MCQLDQAFTIISLYSLNITTEYTPHKDYSYKVQLLTSYILTATKELAAYQCEKYSQI